MLDRPKIIIKGIIQKSVESCHPYCFCFSEEKWVFVCLCCLVMRHEKSLSTNYQQKPAIRGSAQTSKKILFFRLKYPNLLKKLEKFGFPKIQKFLYQTRSLQEAR